ncbi:MAG: 3-phosphoshikimate 1-carboxyvinyltransferase [Deltaproteobacteria bacterium]|nr:3-phosphoshikimate 1-carboxyvinyltransferase [Deltaproteobacteria bacterium]
MSLRVTPKRISRNAGPLDCPPDKSVTHRSFLFSLLSSRKSVIQRPLLGEDCLASLAAVAKLGGQVERKGTGVEISGFGIRNFGTAPTTKSNPLKIDCQNSGTTIRLLSGLLAGQTGYFHMFGDGSLSQRPMARVSQPLLQMGAAIYPRGEKKGAKGITPTPPIDLEPAQGGLRPLDYAVASLSGSLGRDLSPLNLSVGGDPSSAAFWACAAVMQGQRVCIENVLLNPTRMGFATVLSRMGAAITTTRMHSGGGEDVGTVEINPASLRATEVLPHEIPTMIDEVPMVAIAALWARGTTVFRGVQELRVKESDRLEAIISFIGSIGGKAWAVENDLFIEGLGAAPAGPKASDWFYETLGDHRLAMAAVITADALQKEILLDDAECIKVSYPGFFEHREALSK